MVGANFWHLSMVAAMLPWARVLGVKTNGSNRILRREQTRTETVNSHIDHGFNSEEANAFQDLNPTVSEGGALEVGATVYPPSSNNRRTHGWGSRAGQNMDDQALDTCRAFRGRCSWPRPVFKGSTVKCIAGQCNQQSCCEPQGTCKGFKCSADKPVPKSDSVKCPGAVSTCTAWFCCRARATCADFSCVKEVKLFNKGSSVSCSGDASTCTAQLCCENQKLWAQDGSSHSRCKQYTEHSVSSFKNPQRACQAAAANSGDKYYHFRAATNECASAAQCALDSERYRSTGAAWRIYHQTYCSTFRNEGSCPLGKCMWTSRRFSGGKPSCSDVIPLLNIGGVRAESSVTLSGRLRRPQLKTTTRYSRASGWEACGGIGPDSESGNTDCWRAEIEQVSQSDGTMVNASGIGLDLTKWEYKISAVEIPIQCEYSGIVEVQFHRRHNTLFKMWYNLEVVPLKGKDKILLPVNSKDPFPLLRIQASRGVQSRNARAFIRVVMTEVDPSFEKCMSHKQLHGDCLDTMTTGNTRLRSDHNVKVQCLAGNAATRAAIELCDPWRECLSQDAREVILNVSCAFSDPADPHCPELSLIQVGGGMDTSTPDCAGHGSCVNPWTMDVEAFNCNCFDTIQGKSPMQIIAAACIHPDVCCQWKEAMCGGAELQEDTKNETLPMATSLLRARRTQATDQQQNGVTSLAASLDKSLSFKRTCTR